MTTNYDLALQENKDWEKYRIEKCKTAVCTRVFNNVHIMYENGILEMREERVSRDKIENRKFIFTLNIFYVKCSPLQVIVDPLSMSMNLQVLHEIVLKLKKFETNIERQTKSIQPYLMNIHLDLYIYIQTG